jgi:tetratricopeptide (TPR) repeat protein
MGQGLLCFVVMPYGTKPDGMGGTIDFDLIYRTLISPAIAAAGMSSLREDEDLSSGLLLQSGLKHVIGAPMAVFDLTTANANVLYDLGVRHALRPHGTLTVASEGFRAPWELRNVRTLLYQLNSSGRPESVDQFVRTFGEHLNARRRSLATDSPIYSLFPQLHGPELESLAEDAPRGDVGQLEDMKRRILQARSLGAEELSDVEQELDDLTQYPPELVLTLFDAYRSTGAWDKVIEVAQKMPSAIHSTTRVQEQLALALNRTGRWEQAEQILRRLLADRGESSETWAILGRVYKDQWEQASRSADSRRAGIYLDKAIDAYLRGFETDWRDPYPGVNAVTLMTMRETPDPRRDEVLPVVLYAAKRKLATNRDDYWDWATLLELYVLMGNESEARRVSQEVVHRARDAWQSATTARNLRLIRETLERRDLQSGWIQEVEQELSPP